MSFKFLTEDWTLKLFSLGVAVLLFLFVTVESATPVDVDFRVEYRTADDIMLTNDAPTTLHTTLQGPWAAFRSFDIGDLEPVIVDLAQAGPGTLRHAIDTSNINPPGGMRVVSVRPGEIEVTLDRRVERQVPVHPDIPEAPAFGYEILDVRIVPPRVRVVGPVSKMQTIDFITTRTIDITGREDDLSLEVDLRPPPPPLRLVDKRVLVFVEIGEEFVQRNFQNVPVKVDNAPKGSHVNPGAVVLTIKGPRRIVDKMDKDSLEAFVDVGAEANDGLTTVEKPIGLRPELPERTQIVAPVPKVEVQIVPSKKTKRR
jgi:YbbR domain-containing protein